MWLPPSVQQIARTLPPHFGPAYAYHPSEMRTSAEGKQLMVQNENGGDWETTAYLHHPPGPSGVTLGPGYDMALRPGSEVTDALREIGVDAKTAKKIGDEAPGNTFGDADAYAAQYGEDGTECELVCLTRKQQEQLMSIYLKPKERLVQRGVRVLLMQHEFDALASFAVNPGGPVWPVFEDINYGFIGSALESILRRVPSRKSPVHRGLVRRRQREVEFFLTGRFSNCSL